MNALSRVLRRKQLDDQLRPLQATLPVSVPKGGWIRAIREALGLTLDTFGKRLGVSRQTAFQLETAEQNESLTLKRLRAAADALDCDLAVLFVPRASFEDTVRTRALNAARKRIERVGHSMALESQAISSSQMEVMIQRTADEMVEKADPRLWE